MMQMNSMWQTTQETKKTQNQDELSLDLSAEGGGLDIDEGYGFITIILLLQ
jgi:hypothetical protein